GYRHTTCVCSSQLFHSSLLTYMWRIQLPRLISPESVIVFDSHSNEMSEGGCCERQGDWWTAVKLDRNGMVTAKGFVPQKYLARRETVKEQPNDREVKHIKAHQNQNGSFYLEQSRMFQSLEKLLQHYKRNILSCGICLTRPCARPETKPQDLSHQTVDDWELPKEEFTLEEELGKGYFADVYRGKWKGMVNVAIKILKNNESLNHREFLMETQILKKLRHRHPITLFAVCTSSTPYYIITELMEKGNLLSFLRGKDGQNLEPQELIEMSSQVADGMAYLEEKNSSHRDLAAQNVLVGHNYICKVADFGLARIVTWCAPEAISHGRFSNKSDVWSFGVLLYEMFTYGGFPYPGMYTTYVYNMITRYRMPSPPKCPSHIYDTMLICWRDIDFN
uniref:non-specific protein-tyrosine kinase n=1 Tax=Sinocyclocheilus grahami TaxID=75366 RepID=A0A672P4E7_SINGR